MSRCPSCGTALERVPASGDGHSEPHVREHYECPSGCDVKLPDPNDDDADAREHWENHDSKLEMYR